MHWIAEGGPNHLMGDWLGRAGVVKDCCGRSWGALYA